MNKILIYIIGFALFFGGMIWWSKNLQKNDPDVVSRNGIHWHPTLAIYVNSEKQEFPSNLGITGGTMMPMHTHEPDGTIHVESMGIMRKKDLTIDQFFRIWGRDINSFGTNVKMTVNGEENREYENYVMRDKDKIELRFD